MGEDPAAVDRGQVPLQGLPGPLAAGRDAAPGHLVVVVRQVEVAVRRQGVGGEGIVGLVTPDEGRPCRLRPFTGSQPGAPAPSPSAGSPPSPSGAGRWSMFSPSLGR